MLKLVSRFVLEVLPYVLTALIAPIVVPGFLSSQLQWKSAEGSIKRCRTRRLQNPFKNSQPPCIQS